MDVVRVESESSRAGAIERGVATLEGGGLVVFPTETVYGVAARADSQKAMARLREVKARDAQKAFTVHVGSQADAGRFVANMPAIAERLMRKAWPGPLTVVIPVPDPRQTKIMSGLNGSVADVIFYEGTVGLRFPDEPTAAAILKQSTFPIVAASANRAGRQPPVTAEEAIHELDGDVDLVIDGGRTAYGRASTVVRVEGRNYDVLREGVYDARTIRRLAALRILFVCTGNTCRSPMAEGLARRMMADRLQCSPADLADLGIHITSAGTAGGLGSAASNAVTVMAHRGVDISAHTSLLLTQDLIHQADHVYAMTATHREAILNLAPRCADRVKTLLEGEDVHDPIGGTVEEYEACARIIETGLRLRMQEIRV